MHQFVCASLIVCACVSAQRSRPTEFHPLFNGRDLTGWFGMGTEDPRLFQAMSREDRVRKVGESLADIREHWKVEDGVLVNDGHGLFLTTLRDFGDFELRLEYATVAKADSGIYLRGIPQVQIWDTTEAGGKWHIGANFGSGGLWNNSAGAPGKDPSALADRPFGEWNAFVIKMIGERVSVELNGQRVVRDARLENYFDRSTPVPSEGPIQLQTHGGEIRWRDIELREIPAAEADDYLRSLDPERDDFVDLLESGDLAAWRGATDACVVLENGELIWSEGRGGTLFTRDTYEDFVVEFEFKLPKGGNNGLAIRYPGEGDPAYAGMCELQVLDNSAEKYAQLDPRQYHGSAYGMVAAHRGYQRPVGQWNFQRVHVEGSRIRVELNGTQILDTDLAEVSEVMAGTPHPGKDRTSGHFGLCGHNDPVRFRNLRIREINS